jgi:integrase/recombinase XerD
VRGAVGTVTCQSSLPRPSTQIYTHVSIDKLRDIHDATHPARAQPQGAPSASPQPDAQADVLLAALAADTAHDT